MDFLMSQMVAGDELSNNVIHQIERMKAISRLVCSIAMFFLNQANMLFNPNFILDFGIIYGALIVGLIKGNFPSFLEGFSLKPLKSENMLQKTKTVIFGVGNWCKRNFGILLAKIIGGIMMGIGAKFGYVVLNISNYFLNFAIDYNFL